MADLVRNPFARVVPTIEGGQMTSIKLWTPVRGRPARLWLLSSAENARAFRILVDALEARQDLARLAPELASELAALGLLLHPEEISHLPSRTRQPAPELLTLAPAEPGPRVKAQLASEGYVELPSIVTGGALDALRGHFHELVREGWLALGDNQSPLRYCAENDPLGSLLLHAVRPTVRAAVGFDVKAHYSYAIHYVRGATLPRHLDRIDCAYSISLLLDFDGPADAPSPWPLHLEPGPGRVATIHQRRGDAVLYLGHRVPHWRSGLEMEFSTSVLLSYHDAA